MAIARGAVRERPQAYNPKNQRWSKRDYETGRFIANENSARSLVLSQIQKIKALPAL